jgi:hypothetical protein
MSCPPCQIIKTLKHSTQPHQNSIFSLAVIFLFGHFPLHVYIFVCVSLCPILVTAMQAELSPVVVAVFLVVSKKTPLRIFVICL